MVLPKCLTAAAVLALSLSAASACDDYAEEMAMIMAQRAVAEAQAAAQQEPAAQAAAETQTASLPQGAASIEPKLPQTANLADTVRQ